MGDEAKKIALAQKLMKLAEARGMTVDQLMKLMELDSDSIGEVLKPPQESKPQYAFDRWNDGKNDPSLLEKQFDDDAKKKREDRLKEITDLREKGILS